MFILKGLYWEPQTGYPQEYNRNIMEYKDPGRYIPIIFLLYSWGSLFGVPSQVPLHLWEVRFPRCSAPRLMPSYLRFDIARSSLILNL